MLKYDRSQAVALRLGKQLKKTNEKIKEQLASYNSKAGNPSILPAVKSCDSGIWDTLQPTDRTAEAVVLPLSVKQQATRFFCLKKRAIEEQVFLKLEMHSTLQWYLSKSTNLFDSISDYSKAEKWSLVKEGLYLESTFNSLLLASKPYLEDASLNALDSFSCLVGLSEANDASYLDTKSTENNEALFDCEEEIANPLSDFENSEDEYSDSD